MGAQRLRAVWDFDSNPKSDLCDSDALARLAVAVSGVRKGGVAFERSRNPPLVSGHLEKMGVRLVAPDIHTDRRFSPHRTQGGGLDALFISFCLDHGLAMEGFAGEILARLRPGGRIVIVDFQRPCPGGFYCSDIRHGLRRSGFSNIIVGSVGAGRGLCMATATAWGRRHG